MARKQIAWNTGSGSITLTYQGQGDGTITVASDQNDLATARSQTITVKTTKGGLKTKNFTITQGACPISVGTVLNYAYTGNYQEVTLPAGQYKLQCWGAQGGNNAAASSYDITAKAGGKGGYSEGVITLSTVTKVRVYVGGAGSSSAGGFNGGGSTTGSSTYNSDNEQGVSRMGGGGGATDIRLSDGALLSRMIVAGGGSGGAMCYQKKTTIITSWEDLGTTNAGSSWTTKAGRRNYWFNSSPLLEAGVTYRYTITQLTDLYQIVADREGGGFININISSSTGTFTCPYNATGTISIQSNNTTAISGATLKLEKQVSSSSTTTDNNSQVGYVGGGTDGGGYSSSYYGKQNSAGSGGSFGQGANQTTTNYRYCSGAGGGGWYGGGGGQKSNSSMTYCEYSGGGSGFVNTAASAGNRPSGYTGLQLDSGTTYAGNQSFPSTGSGNETGHAGNGYARITRLA